MITRSTEKLIKNKLFKGKAILIYGPRQVGKTTILQKIRSEHIKGSLFLNCDNPDDRHDLTNPTVTSLGALIKNHKLILIDEAQRVENIGLCIKLLVDNFSDVQVIATSSSSFDLANKVKEPLTGRQWSYMLFPISTQEMINYSSEREEKRLLEHRLVFGYYPEVITSDENPIELLQNLASSYLYKDIFLFQDIRKTDVIEKLLQALALQMGAEVSVNELSVMLGINSHTVAKYLSLLEQAFVIFRLRSLSRNVRNELKKSQKIYFYDNGIRNALIGNYNRISNRTDTGALWENFLVSERLKKNQNDKRFVKSWFWRTTQQQEIDYIEEFNNEMFAYEFKWNKGKRAKFPTTFTKNYESQNSIITPDNYLDFII
jgi:predicted AAA+ superfamily ATPase